jgi:hypothetical protein
MFARRRTLRRSTWPVIAVLVFSTLAMAPLGLHAHAIGAGAFHPDFCTAVVADGPEKAAHIGAPERKSTDTKRCDDCAACTVGAVALPPQIAPWLAVAEVTDPLVVAQPPAARHDDRLVARPRGPPASA